MTREELKKLLNNKYIYAIKDNKGLCDCISNDSKIVFVLYGSVMNICEIVNKGNLIDYADDMKEYCKQNIISDEE